MITADQSEPNIVPRFDRAGIGWRCRTCGSGWSGAKADHTAVECRRVLALNTCPDDCVGAWNPEWDAALTNK